MRKRGRLFLSLLILAAAVSFAAAKSSDRNQAMRAGFIDAVSRELSSNGELRPYNYSRQELEMLFAGVKADIKPPAKDHGTQYNSAKKIEIYRRIFLNKDTVQMGRAYGHLYADKLRAAEQRYGVPQEIIIAVICLESGFGRNLGNADALTALYTTYANSAVSENALRAREFVKQTAYFLALCKKEGWNPKKILGSSAGALGISQFMSVAWWHYAVDGDGNGKINLFTSHADAIFSTANYLSVHGWKQNHRGSILKYNYDSAYAATILAYAEALKK